MKQLKIMLSAGLIGVIVLILGGCIEENFIPDPKDPRLPKYTESGNQVGGALINDVAWKTNFSVGYDMPGNRAFYFSNYPTGDSVTLALDGIFNEGVDQDRGLSFLIVLRNMSFQKFEDIKSLDGQTFALDGNENYVALNDWNTTIQDNVDYYRGGTGTITFKNIKTVKGTLPGDNGEKYHPLIVSGIFNFTFDEISTAVTLGRFDFYINDSYLDQY